MSSPSIPLRSPSIAVRMCPPEVDDSTFSHLMLTRVAPVPENNSKGRCIEPEGEPEDDTEAGEVIWASKPAWGQVMHVPVPAKSFLGAANVPNMIRKVGMTMMVLSAVALNLTVIGALVKSQQTPAVVTTTKPKRVVVTRPASAKLPFKPMNATLKDPLPKVEPEKQSPPSEDPSEKVMSDSAAHFIIPVPMPPRVPLPPTASAKEVATPAEETLKEEAPKEEVSEEEINGIHVKMLVNEDEEITVKDVLPETNEEKEARERKRLQDLLSEAEQDLAGEHGTHKIEEKTDQKQGIGSGRLHSQDPAADRAGLEKMVSWDAPVQEKLKNFRAKEAARTGPAKFMRMDTVGTSDHETLEEYTKKIRQAQAKTQKQSAEDDESSSDEEKKASPVIHKSAFGFR